MARDHGPSIEHPEQYEALLDQGYSRGKAAAISNAPDSAEHGGHASKYEARTKRELYEQAKDLGIAGRSKMSKAELIEALREG